MPLRMLLPVDDSEASRHGVEVVGVFARALGIDVTLVHALYPEWFRYLLVPELFSASLMDKERVSADAQLARAKARMDELGVVSQILVVEGRPEDIIAKVADRFDMLALGAKVHGDLWEVLVSSVPNELIKIVKKPVIVAKHGGPRLVWPRPGGALRVLCAVDHSPVSERAVKFMERLLPSEALEVTLFHAIDQTELDVDTMGAEERYETLRRAHKNGGRLLAGFAERVKSLGFSARTELVEGSAAETACRLVFENDFDFIVAGRPQVGDITQRVFDSVCHHLFHNCSAHQIIIS